MTFLKFFIFIALLFFWLVRRIFLLFLLDFDFCLIVEEGIGARSAVCKARRYEKDKGKLKVHVIGNTSKIVHLGINSFLVFLYFFSSSFIFVISSFPYFLSFILSFPLLIYTTHLRYNCSCLSTYNSFIYILYKRCLFVWLSI